MVTRVAKAIVWMLCFMAFPPWGIAVLITAFTKECVMAGKRATPV